MKHAFVATIRDGSIEVPLDVKAVFGVARPAVKMTFCGHTYANRVAVYGGKYILGIWKKVLAQHGLGDGMELAVEVELDDAPRVVAVPAELRAAFAKNPKAKAAWSTTSYTQQREWARSITDAKGEATKARRVARALAALGAAKPTKVRGAPKRTAKPAKRSARR